jgi:hypothetical protein
VNYIDKLLEEIIYPNEIIKLFYLSPISTETFKKYKVAQVEVATDKLIGLLKGVCIENIINIIEANRERIVDITPANIPQFSNIDSINDVLDYVNSSDEVTYELIGYYINKDAKKGAQIKYGENHYKTAASFGLTTNEKPFKVTALGKKYMTLLKAEKIALRNKLFLLVPIVQQVLIDAKYRLVKPTKILNLYLSESTSIRRRSNVKTMVESAYKEADTEFVIAIEKNLDWK